MCTGSSEFLAYTPEHPPLVKPEAALPLLPLGLPANPPPNIFFRAQPPASVKAALKKLLYYIVETWGAFS
jgi:hypothetical protein